MLSHAHKASLSASGGWNKEKIFPFGEVAMKQHKSVFFSEL
jgi:hypothetical protein